MEKNSVVDIKELEDNLKRQVKACADDLIFAADKQLSSEGWKRLKRQLECIPVLPTGFKVQDFGPKTADEDSGPYKESTRDLAIRLRARVVKALGFDFQFEEEDEEPAIIRELNMLIGRCTKL